MLVSGRVNMAFRRTNLDHTVGSIACGERFIKTNEELPLRRVRCKL